MKKCLNRAVLWLALQLTTAMAAAGQGGMAYPAGEEDRQWAMLIHDLQRRAVISAKAGQTLRPEALILATDRDPLDIMMRRTAALLANLSNPPVKQELQALATDLGALAAEAEKTALNQTDARRELFRRALVVRRRIAWANPLLDFDELVFTKRHRALLEHMCDQYYGMAARPGGGVFVLKNPFGDKPGIRDLLEASRVKTGRLKGQKLDGGPTRAWNIQFDGMGNLSGEPTQGGSFLSPDLSYDGKSLLFAYVECQGDRLHRHHTDATRGHWAEGRCYHVFKVGMDGSNLEQLTDGTWNDFDPCWLPSGRIAFISERRGGYLRCGRVCPTYTVYDMDADGGDIRCLSFHETNEWNPSVTPDGMIMYTRWDYVDRHGVVAHAPWIMTPDGRNPRVVFGNYSFRSARPDMELGIRAIPGSHRYVATAAPHHGQSYGSLVVFDPQIPDEQPMASLKRLTPDVDFPETQGGTETYGEAWPLSEDYHLCAYDPAMEVPGMGARGNYGIYLVDSFGNRELIYRDPEIGCHEPLPVRSRPSPPVAPEMSVRAPEGQVAEATVGVVDVYQSMQPWPEGTKIKSLRVFQILPLSVPSASVSHNTGIQIPQGSDSVNLARAILGEVPVESDGSAYFTVPARKELFFQVVDEQGLAVTSMRSAAQFQAGENSICQGCHEPGKGAPAKLTTVPLAMRRAPSRLLPGPDGTNPFSYPRLVQPILDRHCVACHAAQPEKAPRLDREWVKYPGGGMNVPTTYYASYVSLAPNFGFYNYGGKDWQDPKWYRTTPGEFGARASKLHKLLEKGHYDVALSPEDRHRIDLWLDSCSPFFGVYEEEGGMIQLRGEIAKPTLE
jgi:hypothetical protein